MTRFRTAGFLLLSLALVHPAAAQTPAAAAPQAQTAAPIVKLHNPGAAPRRVLRYKVAPATASRVDMTMTMSVTMNLAGMGDQTIDVPLITFGMDVDVKDVTPAGDITFRFTFADAKMEGPNVPGSLSMINGLGGAATVTDRGVMKTMTFDAGDINNPAIKQILSSSGVDKMSAPLPEEAVGVGAKWEVIQDLVTNGMQITQTVIYELTALDDTTATMTIAITQSGPAQKIAPEGMPPGTETSLLSLSGTGTGKLTLQPGALALFGEMSITSKIAMQVTAEGTQQNIATETRMKMGIAPGKR